MTKITLNPAEVEALNVGCPLCGSQKGKKCHRVVKVNGEMTPTTKFSARPHKDRVDQARDIAVRKVRTREPVHVGFVREGMLQVATFASGTEETLV